ncbi:serine/threonine-protein kinase [Methanospirillum purgamenti]|nr:serine/threonine-protein kinase [Methanospirillum hungatei]MDX8550518.1 serine/threonine-protein kinase [Methanospirillum hungatei]
MVHQKTLCIGICLILALIFSCIPVQADQTIDNSSPKVEHDSFPGPNDSNRIPFYLNARNLNQSAESESRFTPEGQGGMFPRDAIPPDMILPFENWQLPLISIGVSLIILLIMSIAGIVIGSQFRYTCSHRAGIMLAGCHLLSAFLIGVFIFTLYEIRSSNNGMDPFVSTIYATFGIIIYLILSSLIQAVSLIKNRPMVPIHQAHILFAVIAIILLLSVRFPVAFSLQISIVTALTIITPGAAFSLITSHFVQKGDFSKLRENSDHTITRSLPLVNQDLPPSFPEKLTTKYHDISVIGSGGMAVVYRANKNSDNMVVALKIPFSADETSGKTFLNEMSVWRDLSHPHIAQITDQNIFPVPYVELEYIPRSLKDITLPVPPKRAVSITVQIGSALFYAHENGVIHRDIKPGNVLIADDGTVKLTDWGLSRFIERADDTRNTSFSLFYASPEQLAPEKYGNGDQRTDIYQLGVLLYELLCGAPPYGTQNIGELFSRIQKNQYILPSEVNSNLKPFDEIIKRSLQADPNERYQNISDFMTTLNQLAET